MFVLIKGAGDLASGIAVRLSHCGFQILMTDLEKPTSIRRTVCFSEAIRNGTSSVEDVCGVYASSPEDARNILKAGKIPVLADPECRCLSELHPDIVVDAIIAKRNLGTSINDAEIVIGVGPGFTAGIDCHAVIETQRGHNLGRVILSGAAAPNSGIPGNISGFTVERILRAPQDGIFHEIHHIGEIVDKDVIVADVDGIPIISQLRGTIRGLLPTGTPVYKGMKSGDIDPRCVFENCYTVSDKARAIGGGVLEAILSLSRSISNDPSYL